MPKVSILIPAHNYASFLPTCLESIFAQRGFSDFEVILIDDASSDETAETIARFSDPRLRVRSHEKNQGHIRTMNEAFGLACGNYLVRMDADDFWHPDFLRSTVEILDREEKVGLVHTNYSAVDRSGRVTASRAAAIAVPEGSEENELPHLLLHNYFPPNGVLFRRACLSTIGGGYPEELPFAEDWNLWLSSLKRWRSYCLDRSLVYYRLHGDNLHHKLLRAGQKERCEIEILTRFFRDSDLPAELAGLRGKVLAHRYTELARAYFYFGMLSDSRRCALLAARWRPSLLLGVFFWDRMLASFSSPRAYRQMRRIKWLLRGKRIADDKAPLKKAS